MFSWWVDLKMYFQEFFEGELWQVNRANEVEVNQIESYVKVRIESTSQNVCRKYIAIE